MRKIRELFISLTPFQLNTPFHYSTSPTLHNHIQPFLRNNQQLLDFFSHLLKQSITIRHTQQIHTQILLHNTPSSAFLAAALISSYARLGALHNARNVFDTVPLHCLSNLLLWNSILRVNVTNGEFKEALRLYFMMTSLGILADGFTFPLVVRASAHLGDSKLCKIIHCLSLQLGFQGRIHVTNELLGMYGKLGLMDVAGLVFDRMVDRNHISWNTMISGFSLNYDCHGAFEIFRRMKVEGFKPNPVTWTSLLSSHARCGRCREVVELYGVMRSEGVGCTAEALAVVISVCADSDALDRGIVIHGYVIKAGFGYYSFVKNSLVCMYGKHGAIREAECVFSEIESKDIVAWNALISSFAEAGLCDKAFGIFSQLDNLNMNPVMKPNVISWSAVIGGFASCGRSEKSLELFRRMQHADMMTNSVTISSILSVCADLSALVLGREIHAHVIRGLMDSNILVGNGLVNMYMKCGSLKAGYLTFEKINCRDLYSWNTVIAGYGMHGLGENSVSTFTEMVEAGYKPDEVTFVAVLSACSHAGLVTEGRKLFHQMKSKFKIEPQLEHYACMVDLLGRAGFLREASDIVKNMPMHPNDCVLGALLNSCRMYKNTDVAQETASVIFSLNPTMTGSYMLLSNIYSASGKWEDSAKVRISARTRGLKKMPGQSWIEVKKKVHMFSSGKAVQMGVDEVYRILENLSLHMGMGEFDPA